MNPYGSPTPGRLLLRHVIREIELQHHAVALELGRQLRERIGRADGGYRGAVQRLDARLPRPGDFADAASAGDGEQEADLSSASQLHALRHHRIPVPPDGL